MVEIRRKDGYHYTTESLISIFHGINSRARCYNELKPCSRVSHLQAESGRFYQTSVERGSTSQKEEDPGLHRELCLSGQLGPAKVASIRSTVALWLVIRSSR